MDSLQSTPPSAPSFFRQARFLLRCPAAPKREPAKAVEVAKAEIINQLKHRLSWLTLQRQEVSTELTHLRASFSACARVPPETWSIIFEFCLPQDDSYVRPCPTVAPLLFCGVSRLWRSVAISTPSLWTSLSVNRNWRKRPRQALLQQWLQRSRSLPLSLEVALSSSLQTPAAPHHDLALVQMLLESSARWRSIRFNITDTHLLQSILNYPMPLLQTLEFSSNSAISDLHLTHAPNLRTVSLLTAPLDPTPISLPWNQLSHLSSRYWTDVYTHLDVMQRCPSLEFTRLHILHAHCASFPVGPPLLMSHLKSLEVVALNGSAMGPILDKLVLPSLTDLTLIVPDESPEYGASGWPMDSVISLVQRSPCPSLHLHLRGINHRLTDENESWAA